jgi:cytochrome c
MIRIKTIILASAAAVFLLVPSFSTAENAPAAFNSCKACHKVAAGQNSVGPSLYKVYGRKAGSVPGFKYSSAMTSSGITWDAASLAKFIGDPRSAIVGNKMAVSGVKDPAAVKSLVEYMQSLK